MKKLFAVLVALTLVLSMGTIAFAEGTTGTIKIDNALEGATYNIYKMFSFEPVAGSDTQGRYTVVAEWEGFLAGDGAAYLKENADTGTIEWVGEETDARKADLAKAAVAYAVKNDIDATATKTVTADGAVKFEGVELGYYAIDTNVGTICALTNVDNTFEAHEKNAKPDIDKWVQEDSKVNTEDDVADKLEGWQKVNDADIDQQVNYKSTITAGYGAVNYVMHDTMEAGLTFNNDVVVELADGTVVDAANYTVVYPAADGHTFDVQFENDFIATLAKGAQFTVYYSATLNEGANIVEEGNDNEVYLQYGEKNEWTTDKHTTSTYTWKMDVLKFAKGEGDAKNPLANASFQLKDAEGNLIKFSAVYGAEVPAYMVDKNGALDTIITDANGKFEIVGLDEGEYELEETVAPEGYNLLAAPIDVKIDSTYVQTEPYSAAYTINGEAPATIEVENKTGTLLPETGGIGTTIFYVVGVALMLAAAVLLVSKKRMASFA